MVHIGGHMKKRYVAALSALLLLGGVFAAGLRIARPAPKVDIATITDKAKTYDALIERDRFGVPHISGPRDADVAFGLGYAHSEDDFATIVDTIVTTRGIADRKSVV